MRVSRSAQPWGLQGMAKENVASWPIIRGRPDSSLMSFNDGSAHREPDSHSVGFGRIERFEDLARRFRRESDSRIFHA